MTKVWDPRQSWCGNSSISRSDLALAVGLSPNFAHFYIVERGISFFLTALAPIVTGLTWRRKFLVLLLAWLAENKARYVDMHTLETCLLKVTVSTSRGTLLLWKLVLSVGSGEQNCTTCSIHDVLVLTIGVDIFVIGAGYDMLTRTPADEKTIVSWNAFWTAGTCYLFSPWYTTLLPSYEETLSAILVFSITLRIYYMVNWHKAFVGLYSLAFVGIYSFEEWIAQLTVVFNQCSELENKMVHLWLHLSYGIVIILLSNGIGAKKYVSLYKSDTLLLLPMLYLNLEDKVLIDEESIVVNTDSPQAGQVVGPGAKPRRGPIVRQPNTRFAWDPG